MATKALNGSSSKFDPNFTQNVISAIGPKATPRAKQVIGSLIQHLHDFARENEITVDEWMSAVDFVSCVDQNASSKG
jgi:catechol 1,2-dioxygenase